MKYYFEKKSIVGLYKELGISTLMKYTRDQQKLKIKLH